MGAIQSFLSDKLQAQVAEQLIDDTTFRVKQRTNLLNDYMPIKMFDNEEFLMYVTERLTPIASFVSEDGRLPTTSHGNFQRMVGELQRVGLAKEFDEKIQKEMLKVMDEASYKNAPIMSIPNGREGGMIRGLGDNLANYIYDRVEGLIVGITDLLTAMAWDVVSTGEINRVDPRTGLPVIIDFKDSTQSYTDLHFPAALVATGNTANPQLNKWDDLEYADGIGLLQTWALDYLDTNGFMPDLIVMPKRTRIKLMQQRSTIEKSRQLAGFGQVGAVSPQALLAVLEAYELPPIVSFDEYYQIEYSAAQGTNTRDGFINNTRFLPEGKVCFLKRDMGISAMGASLAMKYFKREDGRLSGDGSSILVRVHERSKLPMLDEIEALSLVMPCLPNPRYAAGRTVL
jgi:hypothetical protein